jgi:hypothetical protein
VGILTDFIVAAPSAAATILASAGRKRWPTLQGKGITVVELALLHFILTGEDADARVGRHAS